MVSPIPEASQPVPQTNFRAGKDAFFGAGLACESTHGSSPKVGLPLILHPNWVKTCHSLLFTQPRSTFMSPFPRCVSLCCSLQTCCSPQSMLRTEQAIITRKRTVRDFKGFGAALMLGTSYPEGSGLVGRAKEGFRSGKAGPTWSGSSRYSSESLAQNPVLKWSTQSHVN